MGGSQGVDSNQELYRFVVRASALQAQALLFAFDSLGLQFEHSAPANAEESQTFVLYATGSDERQSLRDLFSRLPTQSVTDELYPYDRFAWVEKWKESYEWSQLTARVAVGPDFRPCPFQVPVRISMAPGQTFGTGVHETTRIALRLLDTYVAPGMTVCDAGTGTGVLAIAARMLGAGHTVGFDISPDADEETAANAKRNGVEFEFHFGAGEGVEGQYDIVVGNMLAHELLPMSQFLRERVKPGGVLILTGLIEDNFDKFEYLFFDLPMPAAPSGWKSPTLAEESPFLVLEKRWENEWWGGAWRRRS